MRRGRGDPFSSAIHLARSPIAGYPIVIAAVGVTSWIVGDLQAATKIYDASILYLLVILGAAISYGIGPAVVAALAGLGLFDWFLDPVGTLLPDGPAELLTLSLFLIVGIVTSELAAGQRRRADEALHREREATSLYSLNSLLVSTNTPSEFLSEVFRVFKDDLKLDGLTLLVPDPAGKLVEWSAAGLHPPETFADQQRALGAFRDGRSTVSPGQRGTYGASRPSRDQPPSALTPLASQPFESLYVPVRANGRPMGVLRFWRGEGVSDLTQPQRRFLAAIGQQTGIALERARLQREAAEAAALHRAEELKTAVLNSVTHDLRTPLAMIKASAESLRKGVVEWSDDEKDGFVQSIARNADRLDRIVGNLLELSRIDAGMAQLSRQYYPLSALVDDVTCRLEPLFAKHNLIVDVSDDLPPVLVDYVAIDRVLSNLLENAVHHTPDGTTVVVHARKAKSEAFVSVSDDGPGISTEVLPHVFERFYRGRVSRPEARHGAGLGLAVVKGLVAAHHGRVWVDSDEGRGAKFSFSLPIDS